MGRGFLLLMLSGLLALAGPACAQAPAGRFDGWAAVVIAADWRDGRGQPIDAFDNARRDVTAGLLAAGLPRDSTIDLTLNPASPRTSSAAEVLRAVADLTGRAQRGCLLYFTSHGSPEGMVFGEDGTVTPASMAQMVRQWCGTRPTVVIVSACFSGIFVNALEAPNRMILTAASRERTSFGCGAGETYPWFDGCVIESLPQATDFLSLAAGARACVARREQEAGIALPSEPQLFVGAEMQLRLPTLRFERSSG